MDTATGTFSVTTEDVLMNQAIDKAKRTINDFDAAFKSGNQSYFGFAVKKRYVTPDGGGEHMWVAVMEILRDGYKGFVNNDAEITQVVKYGDTVIVRKNEITDWMYVNKDVLKGGYTTRVIRSQLSKKEQVELDKSLGYKIEDWKY